MGKAAKLYQSLSQQQKQFYKEKTLSTTMKVKQWIAFLSKISTLDKLGDGKIKKLMGFGVAAIVITVVSFFVALISETYEVLIGSAVFLIAGIILFAKRKDAKEQDINNYLRQFFMPVLNVLKDKAGENAKLGASLDFRDPRKVLDPVKSVIGTRKQSMYSPTYIMTRLSLKDGTLLEFVVKDDIKDLNWKKRSASGKTKYKNKTKFVHQCFIKMTLAKTEYTWNGTQTEGIEVVDHNGHYQVKSKIKIKKIGDHVLHVKAFFEAIQSIYALFQPLNPSSGASTVRNDTEEEYQDDYMFIPYVWYGGYFDDYDYDSFDYSDTGEIVMEDEAANVFDS
ncbi:MAG: hypothetical protein AAF363_07495 [Bacteroidota bacterium]